MLNWVRRSVCPSPDSPTECSGGSEYNYSLAFSQQGNYVSARAYYERALQLVPDSKLLQENLAKLDRLEKRLQEVRGKDQT